MIDTVTDARPRPHPAVETAFLAPEAVLWDTRHQQVHHLNPSASAVWLLIDGELTADQIARELCDIFGAEFDAVRPDVDDAIAEFVRRGLLVGDGPDGHGDREVDDDPHHDDDLHGHDHDHHDHHGHADSATPADASRRGVTPLPRPPDP